MKEKLSQSRNGMPRLVAKFGRGKLVRAGSQLELHGGSRSDWLEAQEWISLFCHEALLKSPSVEN